jgi:hypothetical protein
MRPEDGKSKAFNEGPGPLGDLPSEIASEFVDWVPPWLQAQFAKAASSSPGRSHLSQAETCYLQAVVSCPGQPSSAYAQLAGISARKALQVRKRLVELGCVREHVVNAAGRGRPSILLEPTAQAQKTLDGASEAEKKQ